MRLGIPYIRPDDQGRPVIGLGDDTGFSTDSGTGINTTGLTVNTPTASQTDYALNALAQQTCSDQNGIWDPTNHSCSGSGGSSNCPDGYVLSGSACVKAGAAPTGPACPAGATCSIIPGIANTSIYLALAAVATLFLFASMGGRR